MDFSFVKDLWERAKDAAGVNASGLRGGDTGWETDEDPQRQLVPKGFNRDVTYGVGGTEITTSPEFADKEFSQSFDKPFQNSGSVYLPPSMPPVSYQSYEGRFSPSTGPAVLTHELAHQAFSKMSDQDKNAFVRQLLSLYGKTSLLKANPRLAPLAASKDPRAAYLGGDAALKTDQDLTNADRQRAWEGTLRDDNGDLIPPSAVHGDVDFPSENYAMLAEAYADQPEKNPFKAYYSGLYPKSK